MRTTGVVRRIDDLGRIVIPKEIRKSLRIREGESLEIYSGNQNEIILKKYSFIESIESFSKKICDAFYSSVKKDILITDTEKVICASGSFNKRIIGKKISAKTDKVMQKKELALIENENFEICEELSVNTSLIIRPISIYGDIIGAIIIFTDDKSIDSCKSLANYLNKLINEYFEE